MRPLEIWVFSNVFCWIVFSAKKIPFSAHARTFSTDRTCFHNNIERKYFLCYHNYILMSIDIIFIIAIVVMSAVIHEFSHGYAAFLMGDPTAKHQGRLTLNPIPHIDPVG